MMDIPIDDQYSLTSKRPCTKCSYRHIVEQTKAHGCFRQRVMPGGTYRAKSLFVLALVNTSNRIASGPCGQRRGIPRTGRYHRIGFDTTNPQLAPTMQLLKVAMTMISFALIDGRSHPIGLGASFQPALILKHPVDFGYPCFAFRVTPRIVFLKDFTVIQ
jgi:hypothetical protein